MTKAEIDGRSRPRGSPSVGGGFGAGGGRCASRRRAVSGAWAENHSKAGARLPPGEPNSAGPGTDPRSPFSCSGARCTPRWPHRRGKNRARREVRGRSEYWRSTASRWIAVSRLANRSTGGPAPRGASRRRRSKRPKRRSLTTAPTLRPFGSGRSFPCRGQNFGFSSAHRAARSVVIVIDPPTRIKTAAVAHRAHRSKPLIRLKALPTAPPPKANATARATAGTAVPAP